MPPALSFAGSTAAVTGAGDGIGAGIAMLLADLGARVVAIDRDADALARNLGDGRFANHTADIGGDSAAAIADAIWDDHGPINLVVNNVGVDTPHGFMELGTDDFDRVFGVNLRGPWFFTKRIVERMLDDGSSGSILFVSSLHDTFVRRLPHYSASKAAVAMLVKELAVELAPHGVRVNAISPGVVQSGHVPQPQTDAERAEVERIVPLGRIGQPGEVARIAAVLLSDEWAGYVTGVNVRVDGGLGLHSWSTRRS